MRDDQLGGACENRTTEYLSWRNQRRTHRSECNEMASERMIFAVEVNAVERLLHRVLLEGRAEVFDNLLGPVETDSIAARDERINHFGFVNAHGERSLELRFPSRRCVE